MRELTIRDKFQKGNCPICELDPYDFIEPASDNKSTLLAGKNNSKYYIEAAGEGCVRMYVRFCPLCGKKVRED